MTSQISWSKSERNTFWKEIESLRVEPGEKASLNKRATGYKGSTLTKTVAKQLLTWGVEQLSELNDILYAHNQYGMLICLQAMDAAGKDGAIKHIMSGLNPQGVKVTSFKQPSAEELDHDFLWRHYKALPPRGEIGIFNRSHYENVLISRVHPEYVLNENLPHVRSLSDITPAFWKRRFKQINRFESIVNNSGTKILKFFLHLSKEEQRVRLLARIDDEHKNWKFNVSDLPERGLWNEYMEAYEEAITNTSTANAPWYIIPADDKWYSRVAIAAALYEHMRALGLSYPRVNEAQKLQLLEARALLEQPEKKRNRSK